MASSAAGNIHVQLVVQTNQASRFTSAANIISRDSNNMRRSLDGTSRSISMLRTQSNYAIRSRMLNEMVRQATSANNQLGLLRSTMLGLAALSGTSLSAAFAGTYILQMADQAKLLGNQLRTVTTDSENLAAVQQRLYDLSQNTRSSMDATIKIYARTARATEDLGYSQEKLVRITETIQKAFAVGGASMQEATGAAIQLSQAIASNRFSGDEFRSVAENAPVLMMGMAKALNVGIGKLREMGQAGELTSEIVTKAIFDASSSVDADFSKLSVTVGQGITRVHNAFLMYIGDVDQSHGATAAISSGLSNLADHFSEVADAAGVVIAALASMAGGRLLSGIAGGVISSTIGQYQAISKASAENLNNLRQQETSIKAQQVVMRSSIEQQRQKLTSIVNQRHAIGATSTVIQKSYALEKSEMARLTQLRLQAIGLSKAQAAAVAQIAVAQKQVTVAATAANVAMRGLTGFANLFGGWTGLAFTAAIAGALVLADNAGKAAERTASLKKELYDLGMISAKVAGQLEETAKSLGDLTADELRQKIVALRDEMTKQSEGQFWLYKIFNYDETNFGNIVDEIEKVSTSLEKFGAAGERNPFKGADDTDFLRGLNDIAKAYAEQTMSAEDAANAHAALVLQYPEVSDAASALSLRLQNSIPFYDALIERTGQLKDELDNLFATMGDDPFVRGVKTQMLFDEAVKRSADQMKSLRKVVGEDIRVAGLSDDEARLEKTMDDIRKQADAIAEARDEARAITESEILVLAKERIIAEDLAEAHKDINGLLDESKKIVGEGGLTVVDHESLDTITRLLGEFYDGNISAEALKIRLTEMAGIDISAPVSSFIDKTIKAIPEMAELLRLSEKFSNSDMGGPVTGRGALGRAKRELERRQSIGSAVVEAAMTEAGLSEYESFIKTEADRLIKEVAAQGGLLLKRDAEEAASGLWNLKQKQDAAADAAEKHEKALESSREAVAKYSTEIKALDAELQMAGRNVVDADASNIVRELVDSFMKGKLPAEELYSRLRGMSELNLSDGMIALIGKIQAAIPFMSRLLALASMLPGSTIDVAQQSASDRVREFNRGRGITAADTASRLSEAGMTSTEANRTSLIDELMTPADGGLARSREEATLLADKIIDLEGNIKATEDASKAAGEAAEKYAEGMANLNREVELSGMDKFWSEVVSTADSLGIAKEEIEAFISAVNSGGLDAAPQKFRDIAAAMREINANNIMQDLTFERDQMLRSDTEQDVYETLRGSGIEYESVQGQIIANEIRKNALLSESIDLAEEFSSTFFDKIESGMGPLEAFLDTLKEIGLEILKMAGQKALTNLLTGGGLQGSGGLLGGTIIPGILHDGGVAGISGYGHGKNYPSSVWSSALRYHNGGIAGLGPNEIPAILERGETVIPANGNGSGQNVQVEIAVSVDNNGNLQAYVQNVATATSKAAVTPVARAVSKMATQSNSKRY